MQPLGSLQVLVWGGCFDRARSGNPSSLPTVGHHDEQADP